MALTKPNFVFGGWNTLPTGLGTHYDVWTNFTVQASLVLYAEWISAGPTVDSPLVLGLNGDSRTALARSGTAGDVGYYTFTTTVAGTYTWESDVPNSFPNFWVSTSSTFATSVASGWFEKGAVFPNLLANTQYFVKVVNTDASNDLVIHVGVYDPIWVTVNKVGQGSPTSPVDLIPGVATNVTLGDRYHDYEGWFRITTTSAEDYTLSTSGMTDSGIVWFSLQPSPGNTNVLNYQYIGPSSISQLTLPPNTTLYIAVENQEHTIQPPWVKQNFTLSINPLPEPALVPLTVDTPQTVQVDGYFATKWMVADVVPGTAYYCEVTDASVSTQFTAHAMVFAYTDGTRWGQKFQQFGGDTVTRIIPADGVTKLYFLLGLNGSNPGTYQMSLRTTP